MSTVVPNLDTAQRERIVMHLVRSVDDVLPTALAGLVASLLLTFDAASAVVAYEHLDAPGDPRDEHLRHAALAGVADRSLTRYRDALDRFVAEIGTGMAAHPDDEVNRALWAAVDRALSG
ncbi:hypothetical protein [Pseudonocardia alni]|uniref:hypothetical protein n=1 Tax=Pseudonocardia alni TaxID=33907 RepID=UPI0033FBDCF3